MKALYYDGKLNYIEDYKIPKRREDESLIKVILTGICNTDREILKGYRPDFKGVLGHEFVGKVIESDDENLIGKRVVGEMNENCGHCYYCKNLMSSHCENRKVLGMANKDGSFAEYITLRNDLLHIVNEYIKTEDAVFTEPLAAALEITNQIHIKPSDTIAILGDGRLSYMIAQVISLTGADLTIIGKYEDKLKHFENFAKTTVKADKEYKYIIDATGSKTGLNTAMDIVEKRGTIILKTTYAGNIEIDMSRLVVEEINLIGSRCGPFEPALKLLERDLIKLPEIEVFQLKDYKDAFKAQVFKAGFKI